MNPLPPHVAVTTSTGEILRARFYEPDANPIAAVLIVPAMGVSQDFYAALAARLRDEGYSVATFDYRGMGASRTGSLRKVEADVIGWGKVDTSAMVDAIVARVPERPLYWIGHSLGGQLLPFATNRGRVRKMITIATGSGYWLENAPALRWRVGWLWFVVAPVALAIFGYFPGKRLRKVGDLPAGVMRQWRRWCLHPQYAIGVEGGAVRDLFASVSAPVTSLSFTDDELMSKANVDSIHGFYTGSSKKFVRIAPKEDGLSKIGHFGFFRRSIGPKLWEKYVLPELR